MFNENVYDNLASTSNNLIIIEGDKQISPEAYTGNMQLLSHINIGMK